MAKGTSNDADSGLGDNRENQSSGSPGNYSGDGNLRGREKSGQQHSNAGYSVNQPYNWNGRNDS